MTEYWEYTYEDTCQSEPIDLGYTKVSKSIDNRYIILDAAEDGYFGVVTIYGYNNEGAFKNFTAQNLRSDSTGLSSSMNLEISMSDLPVRDGYELVGWSPTSLAYLNLETDSDYPIAYTTEWDNYSSFNKYCVPIEDNYTVNLYGLPSDQDITLYPIWKSTTEGDWLLPKGVYYLTKDLDIDQLTVAGTTWAAVSSHPSTGMGVYPNPLWYERYAGNIRLNFPFYLDAPVNAIPIGECNSTTPFDDLYWSSTQLPMKACYGLAYTRLRFQNANGDQHMIYFIGAEMAQDWEDFVYSGTDPMVCSIYNTAWGNGLNPVPELANLSICIEEDTVVNERIYRIFRAMTGSYKKSRVYGSFKLNRNPSITDFGVTDTYIAETLQCYPHIDYCDAEFDGADSYVIPSEGEWTTNDEYEAKAWRYFAEPTPMSAQVYAWLLRNSTKTGYSTYPVTGTPGVLTPSLALKVDYTKNKLSIPVNKYATSYDIYEVREFSNTGYADQVERVSSCFTFEQLPDAYYDNQGNPLPTTEVSLESLSVQNTSIQFSTDTYTTAYLVISRSGENYNILDSVRGGHAVGCNPEWTGNIVVPVDKDKNYLVLDTQNKFCSKNITIQPLNSRLLSGDTEDNKAGTNATIVKVKRTDKGTTLKTLNKLCQYPIKIELVDSLDDDYLTYRITVDVSANYFELYGQPIDISVSLTDSFDGPYSASASFEFDPNTTTAPPDQELLIGSYRIKLTDISCYGNAWTDIYNQLGPNSCEYVNFDLSIPTSCSKNIVVETKRASGGWITSAKLQYTGNSYNIIEQSNGDWGGYSFIYSDDYYYGTEIANKNGLGEYQGEEGFTQKIELYVYDKQTGEQLSLQPVTIEYSDKGIPTTNFQNHYSSFSAFSRYIGDYSANATNLALPFRYDGTSQLLILNDVSFGLSGTNRHSDGLTYATFYMSTTGYKYWFDEYSCGTLVLKANLYTKNNSSVLKPWSIGQIVLDLSW